MIMGVLQFIADVLHFLNQVAEPAATIILLVLGKRYVAGQNVLDAVNKAKELSILAEDLVRLILVRIPAEHAATLMLDETRVGGKTPAAFLAGKAGVSEDTAERALLAAQSRLAEKL